MEILVDTSVWISHFRNEKTPAVLRLYTFIEQDETILTGDLILTEILQGVQSQRELIQIDAAFRVLEITPLVGEPIARQSADHYRQLRLQGITVRKTIDCLIATWCIYNEVLLLHSDRDFKHFLRFGLIEA
ncbi:MAG: PIN domain-containing protein [Chloroflexi bacterium]|nr:PIN domain-containing protein [Chloroflexota bacterium]